MAIGVENLFKRKKQGIESLDNHSRDKMTMQFVQQLFKSDKRLEFKQLIFNEPKTALLYEGSHLGAEIQMVLPRQVTKHQVNTITEELLIEMDYVQSRFNAFYPEEVKMVSYRLSKDEDGKPLKTITVALDEEGNERSVFLTEDDTIVNAMNLLLSGECALIEGVLTGRGGNFQIDQWNLVAFLNKNKGKRIRVEVLLDEEETSKTD